MYPAYHTSRGAPQLFYFIYFWLSTPNHLLVPPTFLAVHTPFNEPTFHTLKNKNRSLESLDNLFYYASKCFQFYTSEMNK